MGVISMASPIITAVGVYNKRKKPRGPLSLEKAKNKRKPRATVGMPIKELKIVFIKNLPWKSFIAIIVAMGIPQRAAIKAAEPETNNERNVISIILGSIEKES
jgi:hypothetical protein